MPATKTYFQPAFVLFFLIITIGTFYSCKKSKPVTFSGQLLLSKKYPRVVAGKQIEIYQPGSPSAILFSASSSSATTTTDGNGQFSLNFAPGKSWAIFVSTTNAHPLRFASAFGDTSFPVFSRNNFPGPDGYNAGSPLYVGKIIDTVMVSVKLTQSLLPSDTLAVKVYTLNGVVEKDYTAMQGASGDQLVLDTFYNAISTGFDCETRRFGNPVNAGKKLYVPAGFIATQYTYMYPTDFSEEDEGKADVYFLY